MKKYYIYLSLEEDIYLGDLNIDNVRGEEQYSFSFSKEYLNDKNHIVIDPKLSLYQGRQYGDFGFILDMCPDRFGQTLMDKIEALKALKENRNPRKLLQSDYLVLVNDEARMGALRIKIDKKGPFLNNDEYVVPPYIYLRDIEQASIALEEEKKLDNETYRRLLYPASSLGGARPKANIYYNDEIYIAKFPSNKDSYDVEKYEYLMLSIAKKCGIDVPENKLEKYSKLGSTLLIKRFDREAKKRIHYLTMMTALGAKDGDSESYSYLDMVDAIIMYCQEVKLNLLELYRRLIFSYLINNTDNHLRNHALILRNGKYELSPIYDINPTFYETNFALPLVSDNEHLDKETIINESINYGIKKEDALEMYDKIAKVVIEELSKNISREIELLLKITKSRM